MQLWTRFREAKFLEWDMKFDICSEQEWREIIYDPKIISSILWPTDPLFSIGGKHFTRHHPHEINYKNDSKRNESYLTACFKISEKLKIITSNLNCFIYAPLRGAFPIWKAISQFLPNMKFGIYYPVTSSFVFYPKEFGILNNKGKVASGRYNNIQELKRIKPFLQNYDILIYVDEIISGGMMQGHLREMFRLRINEIIPIIAVGLADRFGERAKERIDIFKTYVQNKQLKDFIWEGCSELITEDQKFILGIHYVDYLLGPHIIPVLDNDYKNYNEKLQFDKEVFMQDRNIV